MLPSSADEARKGGDPNPPEGSSRTLAVIVSIAQFKVCSFTSDQG